jgi:CRP/FNR family transcriptional regulator, cyclic AMP receptor protein
MSAGVAARISPFKRHEVIYAQGDRADSLLYIQTGAVQLSVLSKAGRRAIVALLGPGAFFGEGCLVGQTTRTSTAIAIAPASVLAVAKDAMLRLLRSESALSDRLIADLLARNQRTEEDLIDQMFNPAEHRLARKLVALTVFHRRSNGAHPPSFSQETLADMVGTTRSRVNFFLKKFERLGLVSYTPDLTVNDALLRVILRS